MSTSPNSSSSSEAGSLAWLLDVSCPVEVVLGSSSVTVRQCLALAPGSVVPLSQPAGTDLELRAAGVPLAQGEVVILEDRTHLRINRILPPTTPEVV